MQAATPGSDFVLIKGGTLRPGIQLDDFEMLDHPITNAEYKLFVDATKHPAPPYWQGGRIPAGLENHPVIFVSRYNDVRAYTNWRTQKEGRVYRLPTSSEFEYAARAGRADVKFPWGNDAPAGKANFSAAGGERDISIWRQRLQPVKRWPRRSLRRQHVPESRRHRPLVDLRRASRCRRDQTHHSGSPRPAGFFRNRGQHECRRLRS